MPRVLVLGGAGFIGSRIALAFAPHAKKVTVLDGFLPRTGARVQNIPANCELVKSAVQECADLREIIAANEVVVDSMGWTCHRLALEDPLYDLALNLESHLHVLRQIPSRWPGRVIYLGSRGQYGNPAGTAEITEQTPQEPEDVQGIHKCAAESHFRIQSRLRNLAVASLRFPAVVGPHQPVVGEDIGLFGGFARDLWAGRTVDLYGEGRRRAVIHVDDVAAIVVRLAKASWNGFQAFNLAGHSVLLSEALKIFQAIALRGEVRLRPAPADIAAIDIGGSPVSEARLERLLGELPRTSVEATLRAAMEPLRP